MAVTNKKAFAFRTLHVAWTTGLSVLLLTVAIWLFFRFEGLPLDGSSTAAVALVMTVLVFSGQSAWRLWRRRREVKP
jgi:hypothetical protein